MSSLQLSCQPILTKLGLSALILVFAIGYAASLLHLKSHVGKKDDDPDLSWIDIVGTYAGVERPAPLLAALEDPRHKDEWATALTDKEEQVLRQWLGGQSSQASSGQDAIEAGYDAPAAGVAEDVLLPADVLETRCVRCHTSGATEGGGVGSRIPLGRWPEVRKFAYAKRLSPISTEILTASTHTHALSISLVALALTALLLATRTPSRLLGTLVFALGVGLLLDFLGMWWARSWSSAAVLVPVGGGLFGLGFGGACLAILVDLWRPGQRPGSPPS